MQNPSPDTSTQFENTLDRIFEVLEIEANDRVTIKSNLAQATYLAFIRKIGEDPKNNQIFSKFSGANSEDFEEFKKNIHEIEIELSQSGFDAEASVKEAMKEKIEDFINEVSLQITPDKIQNIKEILSTNIH